MINYLLFSLAILVAIILDLRYGKSKKITTRKACLHSLAWITIAFIYSVGLFFVQGREFFLEFLTCYVLELSFSVDNLFAFLVVFHYFQIPVRLQPRILFWGIIGALVCRLLFIVGGVFLIQKFHFLIYCFGVFLIGTSFLMLKKHDANTFSEPWIIQKLKKLFPIDPDVHVEALYTIKYNRIHLTTFFIVLISIELSDVFFAIDSIAAVFGVTNNAFIAFTSNALAVVSLRSFYIVIEHSIRYFKFLHYGVFASLFFVGLKMLLSGLIHIDTLLSLAILAIILALSILIPLLWSKNKKQ